MQVFFRSERCFRAKDWCKWVKMSPSTLFTCSCIVIQRISIQSITTKSCLSNEKLNTKSERPAATRNWTMPVLFYWAMKSGQLSPLTYLLHCYFCLITYYIEALHNLCAATAHLCIYGGPTSTNQLSYSPQLDLPEGTRPRFGHTVTAYSVCPGRTHTTTFGGCPVYAFNEDSEKKIAETTVMEFGELHFALYHVLAYFVL